MSEINEVYVQNLRDFEYYIRDGMQFSEKQKEEIILICEQIIGLCNE
jgi:hypothetical protein